MAGPSVSMVVPVYNEEELLHDFIRSSIQDLQTVCNDFELILVNDGSSDRTSAIIDDEMTEFKCIKKIDLKKTTGIGNATIEGLRVAKNEIVFWNTVDRVIDTQKCLREALCHLEKGWQLVSFYRTDLNSNSGYQKILTTCNAKLIKFLFPWKFITYQQFQFHYTKFVKNVVFESSSHFVVPELLFKAKIANLKIKECPTDYLPRKGGVAKGGRLKWIIKTYLDIVRLWFLWIICKRKMKFFNEGFNLR